MLGELTAAGFEPLIGDAFTLRAADGAITATLVEANATGEAPAPELRPPFELLWEGPLQPRLQQGTHELAHPALAEPIVLFLVPVAQTETGTRYQAIFS